MPNCSEAILECKAAFEKAYPPVTGDGSGVPAGEVESEMMRGTIRPIPPALASQSGAGKASFLTNLCIGGIIYLQASTHEGNSLILYGDPAAPLASATPGSIEYIFKPHGGAWMFAVRPYLQADSIVDPFKLYPHFNGKLWPSSQAEALVVVPLDKCLGHFPRWRISKKCIVVVALIKVSYKFVSP
jgi:hypothetical protein